MWAETVVVRDPSCRDLVVHRLRALAQLQALADFDILQRLQSASAQRQGQRLQSRRAHNPDAVAPAIVN